jgi:CRISPR/Cas system CSM-associated protein Csm3 (group 7 of RAMP superfamily)
MINYTHRFLAKITLEAESPFAVYSGKQGLIQDKVFIRDANGLPYIPGTTLAGILRHHLTQLDESRGKDFFGDGGEKGYGSRIIIGSALLMDQTGKKVIEGLWPIPVNSQYYNAFLNGVSRDHVKITAKGVGEDNHKFEEELVPMGSRFVFELELIGTEDDQKQWDELIQFLYSSEFRVGSGSRKGFGVLKPIHDQCKGLVLDLTKELDLRIYLSKSSSLNDPFENWNTISIPEKGQSELWKTYILKLKAKDFFIFGAGYGDGDVDKVTKTEQKINWSSSGAKVGDEKHILIPATSIKGALAHRVAFHYNRLSKNYIGSKSKEELDVSIASPFSVILQNLKNEFNTDNTTTKEDIDRRMKELEEYAFETSPEWIDYTKKSEDLAHLKSQKENQGTDLINPAVRVLFGISKNSEVKEPGARGKVLIPDLIKPYQKSQEKIFQHIKIDRFTGGGIDGALFNEKGYNQPGDFELMIKVETSAFEHKHVKESFEAALTDLISGQLPLGGMTTKGHGIFTGTLSQQS